MKFLLFFLVAGVAIAFASDQNCLNNIKCYEKQLNILLNKQIEVELKGHFTYLYLSHLFLRHDLHYPKASKYFREKSNEEMQHAERFIEYQNQRGGKFEIGKVSRKTSGHCGSVTSLGDGFSCAKELEISVTKALTNLLANVSNLQKANETCDAIEDKNKHLVMAQPILVTYLTEDGENVTEHYGSACRKATFLKVECVELAEMITHEFLGHQIEDTKELANFEATLQSFSEDNKRMGSFLADKHFDL